MEVEVIVRQHQFSAYSCGASRSKRGNRGQNRGREIRSCSHRYYPDVRAEYVDKRLVWQLKYTVVGHFPVPIEALLVGNQLLQFLHRHEKSQILVLVKASCMLRLVLHSDS